ncbi:MAG TPA: phosphoribosyltransferase [Gammaproteobacteria bacterium]
MHQSVSQPGFRFADRSDAGRRLAQQLREYAERDDVLVFGLPRGGVPVAAQVADALGAPLEVMVVRKLGLPAQPELAMGAIASGGAYVVNPHVIEQTGATDAQLQAAIDRERKELERRERAYRGERPFPDVSGRTVIVVDDGLATGATMRAAVQALRQYGPSEIVVAVPVAPPHVQDSTLREADRFIALLQPTPFYAVGQWYRDFDQTQDEEVTRLMKEHADSGR